MDKLDILKIDGKEYPFKFAVLAQREMQKVDTATKDDIYYLWLGLKYGAIKAGKKLTLSEDELAELLDDNMDAYMEGCVLLGEAWGKLTKGQKIVVKAME